jgi:hypothetical protein
MKRFSVTFERFLPHADEADVCEADESGFEAEAVSLRDAIEYAGGLHASYEANEWPLRAPRWFTNYNFNDGTREYYEQGITESRSLHIPDNVTDSSRRRIARLLGVKVKKESVRDKLMNNWLDATNESAKEAARIALEWHDKSRT